MAGGADIGCCTNIHTSILYMQTSGVRGCWWYTAGVLMIYGRAHMRHEGRWWRDDMSWCAHSYRHTNRHGSNDDKVRWCPHIGIRQCALTFMSTIYRQFYYWQKTTIVHIDKNSGIQSVTHKSRWWLRRWYHRSAHRELLILAHTEIHIHMHTLQYMNTGIRKSNLILASYLPLLYRWF
jgi:hypothetical protein